MSLGQAIGEVMKEHGLTAAELGIPYSDSMMRKVRSGTRKLAPDVAPIVASRLDKSVVYLEMWQELTDGVGPEWLDGSDIEHHRSSLKERLLREIGEAVQALTEFDTSRPPVRMTEREKRTVRDKMMELLDVISFCYTFLAIICDEFEFSFKEIHAMHHKRLKQAGLVS